MDRFWAVGLVGVGKYFGIELLNLLESAFFEHLIFLAKELALGLLSQL